MKNLKNKMKKVMAMVMMTCMLLTVVSVSSKDEYGVMPCGDYVVDATVGD